MKVLITGTSQGIGQAIARRFLLEGHQVVGIDRQQSTLSHENYTHFVCDVRDREHLPEIDDVEILINNAGTQNEQDIDTNLKALIQVTEKYGIQPAIRSILNIGSASGHTGAEFPEYCASKGGILSMSKAFAIDLGPYGIRSNVVLPGTIKTARWVKMGSKQIVNGDLTPIGDISDFEDIANAAFFFGTDLSKNVTGAELVVDGGMMSQLYPQELNTLKAEKLASME